MSQSRNDIQTWLGLVLAGLALGCSPAPEPQSARPALAGVTAAAPEAPEPAWNCQPGPAAPAGIKELASTDPGAVWDALGRLYQTPVPADRQALTPGPGSAAVWPFTAYYFLGGADGREAHIVVPDATPQLGRGQRAEVLDLVSYLRSLRARPERFFVASYRIESSGSQHRVELLPRQCQLLSAAESGRGDTEVAMLAQRLGELGELTGAYIDDGGELVLLGMPRSPGSPPALTIDDVARAYRAVFHKCDCPERLNQHRCEGAFVSIDPDASDPYGPANVVLAPCIRDSHMGEVFTRADVLLKELASGFTMATGDPLPVPEGHRTEASFGAPDPQASWTRYWLYADRYNKDAYLQLSSDRRFLGTSHFHLSLGVETTGPDDSVLSTDEPGGNRLRGLPVHAFADQINRAWRERYQPYFPVLRELDNQSRLIQIMSWLQTYHRNDQREALFERLPMHFVPTQPRVALRAAATVAQQSEGDHVRSVPHLSYGGVVNSGLITESAAVRSAAQVGRAVETTGRAAHSAPELVARAPGTLKNLKFAYGPAVQEVESFSPQVVKAGSGDLHPFVKTAPDMFTHQTALGNEALLSRGTAEARVAMLDRMGEGVMPARGPPAAVQRSPGTIPHLTVEPRPPVPLSTSAFRGEQLAAPRGLVPTVHSGSGQLIWHVGDSTTTASTSATEVASSELGQVFPRLASGPLERASMVMPLGDEVGGVKIDSALSFAQPADGTALTSGERLIGLHVANVEAPRFVPSYLQAREAAAAPAPHPPLLRIRVDEDAHRVHVGHLALPWTNVAALGQELGRDSVTRSRWLAMEPADAQPILIGQTGSHPDSLWQSIRLARALHTLRADRPALIALGDNGHLDDELSRLTHPAVRHLENQQVQPVRLPLYRFTAGSGAWQPVRSAAEVAYGPGVVTIDGNDPASELTIARLALLGRLKEKTLVVAVSAEDPELAVTLGILLEAGAIDSAVICVGGAAATQLRQAIEQTVDRGEPLLHALAAAAAADPVLVLGGY